MKKIIKAVTIILALICFSSVFACGGNPPSEQNTEIKNMILIIGDGMGIEHVTAGELVSNTDYPFTKWDYVSVNTDSVNSSGVGPVLTDSAAGGTALATGKLTVNGYVGKDHNGDDIKTILDYAKEKGKATGIVTTDTVFGATPSAFSAHSKNRSDSTGLIESQLSSDVDLLCGDYDQTCNSMKRVIETKGYKYCNDYSKIENSTSASKAYWQFELSANDAPVKLENVTEKALNFLDKDTDGFVLMIEEGYIDKHSHAKDFANVVSTVERLNRTVEVVRNWIGERKDTAVFITADHETGGLCVSDKDVYYNNYENSNGEKIYYHFSTNDHTIAKVGLFTYGIVFDYSTLNYYGSDFLIKNIDVFNVMYEVLTSPAKYSAFKA